MPKSKRYSNFTLRGAENLISPPPLFFCLYLESSTSSSEKKFGKEGRFHVGGSREEGSMGGRVNRTLLFLFIFLRNQSTFSIKENQACVVLALAAVS